MGRKFYRPLLAAVLAAVMVFGAPSTTLRASQIYEDDWDQYSTNYYYNLMNDDQREFWDELDAICLNYLNNKTDLSYYMGYYMTDYVYTSELSAEDAIFAAQVFRYSNPQYYYLEPYVMYKQTSQSVGVSFAVYSAFANGKDRASATKEFQTAIQSWTKKVSGYSTDYEKVKAIHDLICANTEYDYGILNFDGTVNMSVEEEAMTQSAYSTFCKGKTVCAGYAQACELLCNALGIDAIVVTSPNHEWNKVRIDDSWYNVDCTWDDQGVQSYTYFAKNDDAYDYELSESASHQEESYWSDYLPKCTLDSGSTATAAGTLPAVTKQTKSVTISAEPVYATDKKTGKKYIKTYKVTMTCATKNASIYYTTDGSTPSAAFSKAKKYKKAFKIQDPSKLKAIAVCDQKTDSKVVSFTYKIQYDGNGATSGTMSTKTCKYSKSYQLAANKFTKKGYTFAGWNTKKDGTGKTYKNKASIKNLASKSGKTITLYAQWKKK